MATNSTPDLQRVGPGLYHVASRTRPGRRHVVDTVHRTCSCEAGQHRRTCWALALALAHEARHTEPRAPTGGHAPVGGMRAVQEACADLAAPGPVVAYFAGRIAPTHPGGTMCGGWYVAPYPAPGLEEGVEGCASYRQGPDTTNNEAEYRACLDALRAVYRTGWRGPVTLYGDSQRVIQQVNGAGACRKPELQALLAQVRMATEYFAHVAVRWLLRDENERAAALAR
jgi:ribonuclease HI